MVPAKKIILNESQMNFRQKIKNDITVFLIVLFSLFQGIFSLQAAEEVADRMPSYANILPNVTVLGCVVCQADFPLNEINEVQTDLTELQEDLHQYLNVPLPKEKIELCLFSSFESYYKFLAKKFPDAPKDRPALYIKNTESGILLVVQDAQMRLNIRHEMTHAILNASLLNVPIWLDEGLAKYFETPRGQRGYENPFLAPVKKGTYGFFGKVPSLPRLEKLRDIDEMGIREYQESWAWVHFMIHYSEHSHKILAYYLSTLRPEYQVKENKLVVKTSFLFTKKETPLTSLLEEYLPDYKKDYINHFQSWK